MSQREKRESVLDGLIDGVGGGADGIAVLPLHQNPRFFRARVERLVRILEKKRGNEGNTRVCMRRRLCRSGYVPGQSNSVVTSACFSDNGRLILTGSTYC